LWTSKKMEGEERAIAKMFEIYNFQSCD
jgi:hypothetical protein